MGRKLFSSSIFGSDSGIFFDSNFCQVLDSHIEYLKTAPGSITKTIDNRYIGQYQGDLYSALVDFGIDVKYHRVILLVNGLTCPTQFIGQFMDIKIPDITLIDRLLSIYNTNKKSLRLEVSGD